MNGRRLIVHIVMPLLAAIVAGFAKGQGVESHIAKHARAIRAQEHRPARMVAVGDIDGDGKLDSAVTYTLEPHHSNTYQEFLVVRSSQQGVWLRPVLVGGKEIRGISAVSIAGGRIELALRLYAESDASCCPSLAARTSYTCREGALVETQAR